MHSSHDMLTLVAGIITLKAPMVLGAEARRRGVPLTAFMDTLPKNISKPLIQVRLMHARYSTGDYTHSDMEIGQCERVAQYLVDLHQSAHSHPSKIVHVNKADVNRRTPLSDGRSQDGKPRPPGSLYRAAIAQVREMASAS